MSTKKKPGTDLAALKARLAKKTGKAVPSTPKAPAAGPEAGSAAGQDEAAPPPADDVPAPGEVTPPAVADVPPPGRAPAAADDVPPPGQVAPPPEEIPAPGEVAAPPAEVPPPGEAAPPAAADAADDEPFGGGVAFDPSAGLIDAGADVPVKSNRGLMIAVALAGIGFGAMVGYLLNQISSKKELVEVGRKKGSEMLAEVQQVADARKTVAMQIGDIEAAVKQDPKKAAQQIQSLLSETFEKHPKVDALFGWQLAAVHPTGVKKVFDLYEEANGLRSDLMYLAGFLEKYGDQVKNGGPNLFGVIATPKGAKLVEIVAPLCGELEQKKPCQGGKEAAKAVGYLVRESVGAEPVPVARGLADGSDPRVVVVDPGSDMFKYAVGMEPSKNAYGVYRTLMARIKTRLENMNKAEKIALTALKNYGESPTVDDSTAQPDPGGGE